MMDRPVIDQCLKILARQDSFMVLDLTGGAPELNPHFDYFVAEARKMGKKVIVRHNLTVTLDGNPQTGESKTYLPDFFASHAVEVLSSLPCYQPCSTDLQRGSGVFEKSLKSLKMLNERGFGQVDSGLTLNLVYNPAGAFLPPAQHVLEADFKKVLKTRYGIVFNRLYTITNMPIYRFREQLLRQDALDDYMKELVKSFNSSAAEAVMCRNQISVGFDGALYDCDFNQMLGMSIGGESPMTVFDFEPARLLNREILAAPHCFGCTAGAGSSCGGATVCEDKNLLWS
jgi:radical SAM/Cys-rich protein